jgi:hypothetical protein
MESTVMCNKGKWYCLWSTPYIFTYFLNLLYSLRLADVSYGTVYSPHCFNLVTLNINTFLR